jgi:hypothetical protein
MAVTTSHSATAQVVFKNSSIIMGYVAIGSSQDVTGYPNCHTSIGNNITLESCKSGGISPGFNVQVANNKIQIVTNDSRKPIGNASYVCTSEPNGSILKAEVIAGTLRFAHVKTGLQFIGRGLSCTVSIPGFYNDRASGGEIGTMTASYDALTGNVTVNSTGHGRISLVGYICVSPNSKKLTKFYTARSPISTGQSNPTGISLGLTFFVSVCSQPNIRCRIYDPLTGQVDLESSNLCNVTRYSYFEVAQPVSPNETAIPAVTPTTTYNFTNTPVNTPTQTPTDTPSDTPTYTPTNTPTATFTYSPTHTSTNTPTATDTPLPTNTAVDVATHTPTITHTATPTHTETPKNTPTNSPTITATQTPRASNTPEPKPTSPIITPEFIKTRPIPDTTHGGEIVVGGQPFAGALVYMPEIVDVALTDKNGFYSFTGIEPAKIKMTIKIRSTQLENGGNDIPTQAGIFVEVRPSKLALYNPKRCPERDKLADLYNAALHLRFMHRSALTDHKILSAKLTSSESKRETARAINRTRYHSSFYLDLSAMLPDRQLTCAKTVSSCSAVNLRDIVRKMRFSAIQVRRESLLFNRQLRQKQLRPDKQSLKIMVTTQQVQQL